MRGNVLDLAVGIIITLLISWLTLVVGPWSSGAFQRQLFRIFQSRATTGIKERTFSASFSQFVIYVDEVSASQVRLKGLLVSDERNAEQSRIILAREGRLLSDEANRRITLRFLDGSISESDVSDHRRFRQTYFSLYDMTLPLRAYVTKLREGGHRVNRYLVQLYSKLSFPLVHVIMALVAIPFALVSPRSGGRAMGIGVAIVIAVGYWIVHSVAIAFAQAELLPAALAAWTANIVFAGIGTALFLSART